MSAKIKEILILSLLILRSSMAEIDCLGLNFFCTTDNTYLPCVYDEVRNIMVTTSSRSEACPTGTFCNSLNEEPCDTGIDCEGKEFFCSTNSSFMMCFLRPDGTYRTNSNVVVSCPEHAYCGDIYGTAPCNLHEETTTEEPTTEEPTTEEPTTEEPTTDEPTTEEPATDEPTTTTAPALGELVGYTCAGAGRYPHPTDCRRYISCVVSGSTYKNSQRQCPNDLVYHPDFDGCKLDTTPCDNMDFKCVATGRFADPLNPSKYVWCLKINGAYHALKYTCPVGKIYDGNNACVEPIVISEIETLAGDDTVNIFSTSRRSLSVRNNDEADDERFIESDEMVADRISLNSNEDASVYARDEKYSRL